MSPSGNFGAEKRRRPTLASGPSKPRQRPTLPQGCPYSTIGPEKLNFRVRDGNGCDLFGIAARKKINEVRSSAGRGQRWVRQDTLSSVDHATSKDTATSAVFDGRAIADGLGLLPARLELRGLLPAARPPGLTCSIRRRSCS